MRDERVLDPETTEALLVIEELERRFPRRVAGSDSERMAQQWVAERLEAEGFETSWSRFETHRSLASLLALHFGLGVVGSVVGAGLPSVGAALHGLAAGSYWSEGAKRGFPLRRLLPTVTSQNLLVTIPARGGESPRLRVVLLAHMDAAFTGLVFAPSLLGGLQASPWWLRPLVERPLATATFAEAALALLDAARIGPLRWSRLARLARWVLATPALLVTVANLEVVLRDQAVPGANDDLTGVAALLTLANRFKAERPDGVELVFGFTGAEEAGLSGAIALVDEMERCWGRHDTVVVAVEGLCHGDLRWFVEGEVVESPLEPWLVSVLEEVAASDPRFSAFRPYRLPAGATDALAFQARGYDAVGVGRIDPDLGTPRHYHLPTDRATNLDPDELRDGIDLVEALVRAIIAHRSS